MNIAAFWRRDLSSNGREKPGVKFHNCVWDFASFAARLQPGIIGYAARIAVHSWKK